MQPLVRALVALGAFACLASAGSAHAVVKPGTIALPCVTPAVSHIGNSSVQGVCGFKFSVSAGDKFKITPVGSADLDIYFYTADGVMGELIGAYTGGLTACGVVGGTPAYVVPAAATLAVVVLSPSPFCTKFTNVSFTYSTS